MTSTLRSSALVRTFAVLLGLVLLVGASPAFAIPFVIPIDAANTSDRQLEVYFEVSPWNAGAGQVPSELDGVWTTAYVANLVWATGMVTVSAADMNAVVDQSDPTNSVFSNINMSSYSFQIDTATGAILNGSFTGTVRHGTADISWAGSVDASTPFGYHSMAMTDTATGGSFDYWQGCSMGMNCVAVGGVTGTIDWTFNTAMGPMTVTVFNPFGNLVVSEVPEPSTALLLALGLLGLAVAGRRRHA